MKALLAYVKTERKRDFCTISEVLSPSMTAMAAPVPSPSGAIGVVIIAGPMVRLIDARTEELSQALRATADEIQTVGGASATFKKRA